MLAKQLDDIARRMSLIAIVATSAIMVTTLSHQQQAYAYHYGGQKWSTGYFQHCTDNTISSLNVDGSTNQSTKVTNAISSASSSWYQTGGSQYKPTFTFGCIDPRFDNFWGAANLGSSLTPAVTTSTFSGSTITRSYTQFNTSNLWTSTGCVEDGVHNNLTYVALHELGHKVRFVDVSDTAGKTSVMVVPYHCNMQNSVKADDSSETKMVYP